MEWVGPPEDPAAEESGEEPAEDPASVVEVVDAGVEGDEPGAAAPELGTGATPIAAYIALGLGVLALVVALLALLQARRKA